jgi:hypothetical protein
LFFELGGNEVSFRQKSAETIYRFCTTYPQGRPFINRYELLIFHSLVMKNKQDITVFVPERLRRSMLVTPGEAKRPGACGTRRITPTCKVELLGVRREGGRLATPQSLRFTGGY